MLSMAIDKENNLLKWNFLMGSNSLRRNLLHMYCFVEKLNLMD